MDKLQVKLYKLKPELPPGLTSPTSTHSYWHGRAWAQLDFAYSLSARNGGKWNGLIEKAADGCLESLRADGYLSRENALAAESALAPIGEEAKRYEVICVGHAHIDMNWMWSFDETVAITLDTFRTVLDLMEEYPEFTYTQTQASVYKIVEDYGTAAMLDDIRRRVAEGRWEVAASTWVEADKNMTSGESMARHQLYTKRYLAQLLGISCDDMQIDFEPDTFGHSRNVPELLRSADTKYYYYNRGSNGPLLSLWRAPSGAEVMAYRDPTWYMATVSCNFAENLMRLCEQTGGKTMLKIYGVGDHGGGPTRRDIERILEMRSWPVYPALRFGTMGEFFSRMESARGALPIEDTEKNAVFTGCYTTQTEIKRANRFSEAVLYESEAMSSLARLVAGAPYPGARFAESWKKTLFSQFHDIITGSCVRASREYAMASFEEIMAAANTQRAEAMRLIAARIDTSAYISPPSPESVSEGAGAGNGISDFSISRADRSCGLPRILHVFNPLPFEREENVAVTIWDWEAKALPLMEFRDGSGAPAEHQTLTSDTDRYWSHTYVKALVKVKAPAMGWATLTLHETDDTLRLPGVPRSFDPASRVEFEDEYILENDLARIEFDTMNGSIRSYVDKKSGAELIDGKRRGGGFRLIHEDTDKGMTAWSVGRHMSEEALGRNARLKWVHKRDSALRRGISIEHSFGRSRVKAVATLDEGSPALRFDVECDWQETGAAGTSIPQLGFEAPLGYKPEGYVYDVPFGAISRPSYGMDRPALSFIAGKAAGASTGLMLWADSKHGFRGHGDALAVSLIRGAYDPDPYPETGLHRFSIALAPASVGDLNALLNMSSAFAHPMSAFFDRARKGDLPMSGSMMGIDGRGIGLSCVKMPEDGSEGVIVRLYETCGSDCEARLKFMRRPKSARMVDVLERELEEDAGEGRAAEMRAKVAGDEVIVRCAPFAVATVKVEF